ncbi:MAG: hypothetical protein J1G38_03255 [Clostridiales bacterium]|nr:hypothetical protein [Clostridiales bacterium]
MTVRNIAVSVARLLQADDIEELLTGENEGAEGDEDVKLLTACINTAAADIAADGFPICLEETHEAKGGVIPLSEFSRRPSTVRSVEDRTGSVVFELTSDAVKTPHDGEFAVTFTVEPEEKGLDDGIELGTMCDRSMLTYISARNYCLVTGRTDEASVWDQMYEAHTQRKRLTRRAKLPRRAWR